MDRPPERRTRSRRSFVQGAAGAVGATTVAGWLPAFRVPAGAAEATLAAPPNFPTGITNPFLDALLP